MAKCVEKIAHDECGSSDALQVFKDGSTYSGWCFACDTFIADPYLDRPPGYKPAVFTKDPAQVEEELSEIDELSSISLPARRLKKECLEYFGIKVGVSEVDGKTPAYHYYPITKDGERIGYKVRVIDTKQMWIVGGIKGADLFGWPQAISSGAKRLYITEGELDAAALHQSLKMKNAGTKWAEHNPAIVSVVSGAGSAAREILAHQQEIKANFKEIIFLFDQDEAGEKATKDVMAILPEAHTVTLPEKDANECVMKGKVKALCNAVLFKTSTPKNTRILWGQDLYAQARVKAEWGVSWPWEGLTDLTRGIRTKETYYIGAGVKMGKSEVVNTLGVHLMLEHGWPVFMAKPEEANAKTVKMVLGKVAGKFFHDPKREFDFDAYDDAAKAVGNKLCLLNLYQHMGWKSLRADIIDAVGQGCKAVFIDPITNLTNGINSGEANTVLQGISQDLAAMAKDLDIAVFIFCHLKAPDAGDSHERGGKVYSHQFSGSRAMMRSCNYMIGMEGNKNPDLAMEQRNMRSIVLLEDREFGESGRVNLFWDPMTGLFSEVT